MYRTSIAAARTTCAAFKAALVAVAALLLPSAAFAQSPPPIDVLVLGSFITDVQTIDQCISRLRQGFVKAGFSNITAEPNNNGVKGVMLGGDNAGVSSVATCQGGPVFTVILASAGSSAGAGQFAPNTQNSRLIAAIRQH
jgi:hypothetical protein